MAHIELYDEDEGEGEEDLLVFDGKPPQQPPQAPRSAHSLAHTDDEAWLAPDTPSPNRGEEEWFEYNGLDGDALHDLLDMVEEAGETGEEEAGAEASAPAAEEGTNSTTGNAVPPTKLAWGGGTRRGDTSAAVADTAAESSSSAPRGKSACARRRPAVAENPIQLAANDWLADAAVLRNKQRTIEARDPRLAPEIEVIAAHGGAAALSEQEDLRRDLTHRMRRIRGGVTALGHHVCNIRAGPEYVGELGRMMDGAERDIMALKDAQVYTLNLVKP
jgi:hypothetical protein